MSGTRMLRSLAALLAAVLIVFSYSPPTLAQATPPADTQAQMKILQQRIDDMSKQLKQMQDEQTKASKTVATVDKAWNTFIKGFFGTLDVSIDYTTKGMEGMLAYKVGNCTGPNGGPPCTQGDLKGGPFGRVGW